VVLGLRDPPSPDLIGPVLDEAAATTALGTFRARLHPDDRVATISIDAPPVRAPWLAPVSVAARIRNQGRATWPALGAGPHGLVTVGTRWDDGRGTVQERPDAAHLPWDLAPGAEVAAHVVVEPPRGDGQARQLEIGLVQDGEWFPGGARLCFDDAGAATRCDR
jgi:hypothetical protein